MVQGRNIDGSSVLVKQYFNKSDTEEERTRFQFDSSEDKERWDRELNALREETGASGAVDSSNSDESSDSESRDSEPREDRVEENAPQSQCRRRSVRTVQETALAMRTPLL